MELVQAVMLYGSETWVMTLNIGRVWGGFHYRVAHSMTGRKPRRVRDGGWEYTPLEEAMAEAGLQEVDTYVSRHQNTVAKFIATRPIMDLCLAAARSMGSMVSNKWWNQDGLESEGMRTTAWEAEQIEREEETEGYGLN